jgi:non-ribosomal peptide synthetase-like protein
MTETPVVPARPKSPSPVPVFARGITGYPEALTTPAPSVLVDEELDQSVRWAPGDWFHHIFERTVDAMGTHAADRLAVDLPGDPISYRELDLRANRLARHLLSVGLKGGDRIGLLFDRSAHPFVAMLAVSRIGAAWVPLDATFPADRVAYICADAGVEVVLTRPHLATILDDTGVTVIAVDDTGELDGSRLPTDGLPDDGLAYIVYTSGTTGRPKGVAINHSSICNFVRVAAEHYGYIPDDRVYQGMTIAFDYSFEESWVPLAAGATLVPAPPTGALLGDELADFIVDREITALCCVPTLLATVERNLPGLRLLVVSGEACPQDLVTRWHAPHRRFLNVYGPTEITVTATWTELVPGEPVTIGRPLPTYTAVMLEPDGDGIVAWGEVGEIAIAGIGLSPGYVNRPDLTANAFITDPRNGAGRLYRTGDLGRIDDAGRIVYLGRIDTQVKIRGYRIELAEIESQLMEHPFIAQAAVTTHEVQPGVVELIAFYTLRTSAVPLANENDFSRALLDRLRQRMPAYMVPVTLDRLDRMPRLPSDKVDRSRLPDPQLRQVIQPTEEGSAPRGEVEITLATEFARVMGIAELPATTDFFSGLGADSLRIARFCAAVRKIDGLSHIATKDVYLHSTVRDLASALATASAPADFVPAIAPREPHVASRLAHVACGLAQVMCFGAYLLMLGAFGTWGYLAAEGADTIAALLRSVGVAATTGLALVALPIVLKWLVIGRFRAEAIPAWSVAYLRFWIVRQSMRFSPASMFAGSPSYNLYLRALGVRLGRNALVLTRHTPIATDLVSIGSEAVIRDEVHLDGYRVESGWVILGPVTIGARALVGEGSFLDIDTEIGEDGELAHASTLVEGARIPAGRRHHGSPSLDAGASAPHFGERRVSAAARVSFAVAQVVGTLAVAATVAVVGIHLAVWIDVSHPLRALAFGSGFLVVLVLLRVVGPRLVARSLVPGQSYTLYGRRYATLQFAILASNSRFLNELFGDSSAIVHYLAAIGIRFRNRVQTGSNFGMAQRQHVSTLCTVGGGSIVSDGFSMPNADYSAHAFRVREICIGQRVFVGNLVIFPPGAAVGDDCLIATKAMVPTDGPVHTGVGLLGSPAFEIPRTVARDTAFDHLREGDALRRGLARKNRHNTVTALLYLLTRFAALFVGVTLISAIGHRGSLGLAAALGGMIVADVLLLVLVDAATRGFRRLQPAYCSLYDIRFWRHERYWKLSDTILINMFDGTPIKPILWQMLGVRVGRRLFDDGATMPERSLVTVGHDVTLGAGAVVHGHSLEDGTFKSDRIRIGSGVTIGPGALVQYGVAIGDGTVIGANSFLMKGESTESGSTWRGNPARLIPATGLAAPAGPVETPV